MPSRKDPRVLPKVLARSRTQRSCVGIARRRVIERPNVVRHEDNDIGKSKRSMTDDSKGKNNKKQFKGNCHKCGKIGHMSKDCRSNSEAYDELAETGCIQMASIDLNSLEIGAVQLPQEDHRHRIGIDSYVAVTVFPKRVTDDYPMPPHARQGEELQISVMPDLGARKVQVKLKDGRYINSVKCGHAQSFDGGVRNERHGTRCLLPQERQKHQDLRVPREQWHET